MKSILPILIIITFYSCKEEPSYNPFDNQFNISAKHLIKDKCDTISAGCGFYNLIKKEARLRPFYQLEQLNTIVAKGFTYQIDTFTPIPNTILNKKYVDSILNLPINESDLNRELQKFNYKIASKNKDAIQIINLENKETIKLKITPIVIDEGHSIVRAIEYFKSKKQTK